MHLGSASSGFSPRLFASSSLWKAFKEKSHGALLAEPKAALEIDIRVNAIRVSGVCKLPLDVGAQVVQAASMLQIVGMSQVRS